MDKIVVCKLVRLASDGGKFKRDLVAKELRANAKVGSQYVEQFNKNWKISGQLYIVDEKATEERDSIKLPKESNYDKVNKEIRESLKKRADELGIEYPKNIKLEKLSKLIGEKENG